MEPILKKSNKGSTLATQLRVQELSREIAEKGYGRQASMKWCMDNWGLKEGQAEKYYYAALRYLMPDNPAEYRDALINRNFTVLENMLKMALDRNDLTNANAIIKTMNQMLGADGKKLEITNENQKITVTFGD